MSGKRPAALKNFSQQSTCYTPPAATQIKDKSQAASMHVRLSSRTELGKC